MECLLPIQCKCFATIVASSDLLEYEFIKEKKESRTYTHIPFQEQERERGKQLQLIFYFCLHTTDTPSGSAYKRVLITHGKTLYQSITSLFFFIEF